MKRIALSVILNSLPFTRHVLFTEFSAIEHLTRIGVANHKHQVVFVIFDSANLLQAEGIRPLLVVHGFSLVIHGKPPNILPILLHPGLFQNSVLKQLTSPVRLSSLELGDQILVFMLTLKVLYFVCNGVGVN